jgi:hypothetical protein
MLCVPSHGWRRALDKVVSGEESRFFGFSRVCGIGRLGRWGRFWGWVRHVRPPGAGGDRRELELEHGDPLFSESGYAALSENHRGRHLCVVKVIDVKFANSDQGI